jgi:hypothetical protein
VKTDQELIDEVMDCFEFEKVAKTMAALEWSWGDGVPELHEIKKYARKQLKCALERGYTKCGGFLATYKDNILELSFIVENWDADRECED